MTDAAAPRTSSESYPAPIAWLAGTIFGAGAGCAAALLQRWFAPIGVFPLAIGAVVGFATGGVWAGRGGGSKRAILSSGALAAVVCLVAWHVGSFFVARYYAQIEQRKVQEALFKLQPDPDFIPTLERPTTVQSYLATQWRAGRPLGARRVAGWWLAAWWIGDAVLVIVGCVLAAAGTGKPHGNAKPAPEQAAGAAEAGA